MRSAAPGCACLRAAADIVASRTGSESREVRVPSRWPGISSSLSCNMNGCTGGGHGFSVAALVIISRGGEGNQQGWLAGGGFFSATVDAPLRASISWARANCSGMSFKKGLHLPA